MKPGLAFLAAAAALLALAACAAAGAPGAGHRSPAATPAVGVSPQPGDIIVRMADNGGHLTTSVGRIIAVVLPAATTQPAFADTTLSQDPERGPVLTRLSTDRFRATTPGTAQIVATRVCGAGEACAIAFRLDVTVQP